MKTTNSSLKIEKTISLPMAVETNVVLTLWNDELWILINSLENKKTFVFRMNSSFAFETITTLSLLATSSIVCKKQLVISGADADGNPLFVAIDNSGKIQWEHYMKITPIIWPVLSYNESIFIAWQEKPKQIERGILNIETNKIEKLEPILVEKPPAIIFPLKDVILATITESNKISIVNLLNEEIIIQNILQPITVGKSNEGIFYAWQETNTVCIKHQTNKTFECIPLKKASLGNLNAISGTEATLWMQIQEMTMDDDYRWKSLIIQKNTELFEVEGFIYSVVSWNDKLLLVQNSKIIMLKKQT